MLRPLLIPRYISTIEQLGGDPDAALLAAGLTGAQCEDTEARITLDQYCTFVDHMLAQLNSPHLGLSIGLQRDAKDFGVLGYAALVCENTREAMAGFWQKYGDAYGLVATISFLENTSDKPTVTINTPRVPDGIYQFIVEETLGIIAKVGGQVSGRPVAFLSIDLPFPKDAHWRQYTETFGCPIRFNQPRCKALINPEWLAGDIGTADTELRAIYEKYLVKLEYDESRTGSYTQRLTRLFEKENLVPATQELAAEKLKIHPRTLRRHLKQEGTSYRELADAFRCQRTIDLMQSTRLSAKQICGQVGFDDVNAFRRSFKRWTGKTFSEFSRSA